jgi:alpha-ketoglutaric semialdehyde dehydrogenase
VGEVRSINPDAPEDVVGVFPVAGADGVDRAVSAGNNSPWPRTSAFERSDALRTIADDVEQRGGELAALICREVGKPITEARGEVARTIAIFRYFAQQVLLPDGDTFPSWDPRALVMMRRSPVGLCALVTPWNFPLAIPAWKAAPALGYGNPVILKPAPAASATAAALLEIVSTHMVETAFQVVHGDAETGEPLVDHPGVAAVSFTGSLAVGRSVAVRVAARGGRCQCEMGGHNASIVLADADVERASVAVAASAMGYAGQKCTATGRVLIESTVYDKVRDALVEQVQGLQVRDPADDGCAVGPLIDADARDGVAAVIAGSNGHVLIGGSTPDGDGFYLTPTLIEVEDRSEHLAREEVFGPVAAMIRVPDAESAVRIANEVRYGLVGSVFTSDLERAMSMMHELDTGLVRVNAPTTGVDFHVPFGGTRDSSIGPREQGLAARDMYTETRSFLIAT